MVTRFGLVGNIAAGQRSTHGVLAVHRARPYGYPQFRSSEPSRVFETPSLFTRTPRRPRADAEPAGRERHSQCQPTVSGAVQVTAD